MTTRQDDNSRDELEDLFGGQILAWVGSAAVLAGLILLLGLAISHGWIDQTARTVLAAAGSLALFSGGAWLHERRGRTAAALAAAAAGSAGMFATVVVATTVYKLLVPEAGLMLAGVAGGATAGLALRWRSQPLAAIGLGGALISPLLAGTGPTGAAIAFLLVASAAAAAVLLVLDAPGLAVGAFALAAAQWVPWVLAGSVGLGAQLVALCGFAVLGVVIAAGYEVRSSEPRLRPGAALLLVANASVVGLAGWFALSPGLRSAWLLALAGGYGLAALAARRRTPDFTVVASSLAVALGDAAAATVVHGPALALLWTGGALASAVVAKAARRGLDENAALLGLGGHISLVLLHLSIVELPQGSDSAGVTIVLGSLIPLCFCSARLLDRLVVARIALDVGGLLAIAVLTGLQLEGAARPAAWAFEALALARVSASSRDEWALGPMAAFLGLASLWSVVTFAPPRSLAVGPVSVTGALLSLGAVAVAAAGSAYVLRGAVRPFLVGAAAITLLYLGSVELVGAFQPGVGADGVFDLPVRQGGQLLLSVLWGLTGAAGVVAGLRTGLRPMRYASLALLGLAAGKLFVYDTSALASFYRVASFVALGVLMLGAAFAYQRIRPPASPDLREVPPAFR